MMLEHDLWVGLCYPFLVFYPLVEKKSETDWESLWKEYTRALENWRQMYESVQKASLEMQRRFS
jgi:hypothetical protein